ncbi:MAG: GGDEF domain-containing protein [Thiomicrospira sp.]|uniref:GGDEF domain-containing protein n=1 Tax=Thiomicrospira sp. TaxID=935 RepID=UPI0019EE9D5E|nr:GGDEF domain-containing protein [Thiomicrospira sp.]MBE0493523.1 GGDEF domain-containing protein [Thiomicrospira sp.]
MKKMTENSFGLWIALSLILVMVLITALVLTAQQLTSSTLNKAGQLVNHQHQKLHSLLNMHIAGQNRTINLQQMLLLDDPLLIDETLMKFYDNASDYLSNREILAYLSDENAFERQWMEDIHQMANVTGPLQTQIARMTLQGEEQQARKLVTTQSIDLLNQFTDKVNEFSHYQAIEIQNSIQKAGQSIDKLMINVVSLAISLIMLSFLFALFVFNRFSHINQALRYANEELEQRVAERTVALTDIQNTLIDKNRMLQKLSETDALTGLVNRFKMDQYLQTAHQRFLKFGEPYQVLFLDIDHFKQINDEHGHELGDKVLVEFASLLEFQFGESNLIGRWGGEEFIMLNASLDKAQACDQAERIRQAVEMHTFSSLDSITVSIGVARVTYQDQIKQVINRADIALYKAKNTGRNRVEGCEHLLMAANTDHYPDSANAKTIN